MFDESESVSAVSKIRNLCVLQAVVILGES